jgi:hypothetical protein
MSDFRTKQQDLAQSSSPRDSRRGLTDQKMKSTPLSEATAGAIGVNLD